MPACMHASARAMCCMHLLERQAPLWPVTALSQTFFLRLPFPCKSGSICVAWALTQFISVHSLSLRRSFPIPIAPSWELLCKWLSTQARPTSWGLLNSSEDTYRLCLVLCLRALISCSLAPYLADYLARD